MCRDVNPARLNHRLVSAADYPGVDYLIAYWMGRYYGFIEDDTDGHGLAWH